MPESCIEMGTSVDLRVRFVLLRRLIGCAVVVRCVDFRARFRLFKLVINHTAIAPAASCP